LNLKSNNTVIILIFTWASSKTAPSAFLVFNASISRNFFWTCLSFLAGSTEAAGSGGGVDGFEAAAAAAALASAFFLFFLWFFFWLLVNSFFSINFELISLFE